MALALGTPGNFIRRYWFPAALVVLFLLAIPGVLLFALNLLGMEAAVNAWLEKTFQLSYSIPIPWWGALALLLVPFAIVLLYFLKLKRKPIQVPSTFLWKKSIEDLHVNSLLQWLRENVLLLLQILTVLVLIYAIMAFRFHGNTGEGKHYIVMIDNSASMSCTDVSPSRLEWAKKEALKEIDAASDLDVGMVIEFNASAKIWQSWTSNRDLMRRAVENIQPTQRSARLGNQPTGIEDALSLADSLANPSRSTDDAAVRPVGEQADKLRTYVQTEGIPTTVHLYSDGRFPAVADFALGNLTLNFHSAGVPGPEHQENVGLINFSAIRDENDPTLVQVFVGAINCRNIPVEARVQIEVKVPGDPLIYEKPIRIPAREVKQEQEPGKEEPVVTDTPGETRLAFELKDLDDRTDIVVHARLLDTRDNFPLDDQAWLVLGVVRKARILIVGKGNEILDKFFNDELLKDVATITRLQPGDLESDEKYLTPARNGDFDLVIFDRCGPKKDDAMPRGNTFFVGYAPPGWKMPGTEGEGGRPVEVVKNPNVKGWMSKHGLLRFLVALHEIGIGEAIKLKELPPRTPLLMESELETPLMLTLSRQSFTDLVMTFPVLNDKDEWNTNWPLRPSFPLFLRNVLYLMGNVSDAAAEETIQPGQVKMLRPDIGVNDLVVRTPGDRSIPLQRGTRAEFAFGDTEQVGVYRVVYRDKVQREFAVNLLDKNESNLEPRTAVRIGSEEIKQGGQRSQPRSVWKYVILAALGLLLLEWYIYNRRVYI